MFRPPAALTLAGRNVISAVFALPRVPAPTGRNAHDRVLLHTPPGMKVQFPGGCTSRPHATMQSDALARERRPLGSSPGGARHSPPKAGGGKDPQFRGGPFSAGTSVFSVIRTAAWYTPFAALRAAVPTGGLYLSGHHFFMGQTACERMAPEGVRWGAAGSRGAASRGGRRRRFRAGRTSPGLVATFPRGKPIFPASGHETAPRPSAAAKAPGGPERSGGGAQRLAFVDVDGHDALLLPEAGKSRFLFSWALRCERYRRALPHQPVSRPAGSNQPEARVLNTYAGLCLDGSLAVIDAQ